MTCLSLKTTQNQNNETQNGINMGQIIGAHEFKSSHYVLPNIKIQVALGLKKKVIFWLKNNSVTASDSTFYQKFSSFGNVQTLLTSETSILLYSKVLEGPARGKTH